MKERLRKVRGISGPYWVDFALEGWVDKDLTGWVDRSGPQYLFFYLFPGKVLPGKVLAYAIRGGSFKALPLPFGLRVPLSPYC
jgi:hypothetical protein